MPQRLEVVFDNSTRIRHFTSPARPGVQISPAAVALYAEDDRVLVGDADSREEYRLTATGSLIHPGVEVPSFVQLGSGVLLQAGVTFKANPRLSETHDNPVTIGDGSRVRDTAVDTGVQIGERVVMLGRAAGAYSEFGAYSRVGPETEVMRSVLIDPSAKLDKGCWINSGVWVKFAARLGFNTTVLQDAQIGENARIGYFTGEGIPEGYDGALIYPRQIVEPRAQIGR